MKTVFCGPGNETVHHTGTRLGTASHQTLHEEAVVHDIQDTREDTFKSNLEK